TLNLANIPQNFLRTLPMIESGIKLDDVFGMALNLAVIRPEGSLLCNRIVIASPPKNPEEEIIREIAKRILQNRYGFSEDQVNALFSIQKNGSSHSVTTSDKNVNMCLGTSPAIAISNKLLKGMEEETIGDIAQRILRDKLSVRDIRAEAYALALSAKNANAGSSRLSCLRRELRNLGALPAIVEATKFPDITEDANKIQRDNQKKAEANRIDYPDHFTLESVKERLDEYDIKTLPDCQALADVIIMLCIRPSELTSLRITDAGVIGYAKNRGQLDIPRKFRSMEKNQERAKELLTWIQNAISSGRMGNPGKPGVKWFNRFLKDYGLIPKYLRKLGAVYGAVVHAKNPAHFMTIAGECLRDDSVIEYFVKINKCNKSFEYKEEQLKYQFLRELTPDNQLEVRRCGLELSLDELVEKLSKIENIRKIHNSSSNHDPKGLNIFDLPELLEQILYFLEIDRSLYPALFVNHLWYHCSAPILWHRIEFFNEDYQKSWRALNMSRVLTWRLINFKRVMRRKIKPLYCSKMAYLRLEGLKISDALISAILYSCPNIRFLILDKSKGFSNIPIIEIARYCPKLLHLSLNSCICLTNRCITEITRSCPKLRHIELGDCSIGNKAVEEIAHNCTNLKYLSLKGCKGISKEVMKKLDPKIKIEHPDFSDNEWSNSDPPILILRGPSLDRTDFIPVFSNYVEASSNSINLERDNILNSLARGDTSDSDTNPDTNTEPEPKSQPKNYNPFDAQIAEIDSMLAENAKLDY
ncbi:13632_t:CDS:2, partial [Entrophospora sp. SA101]